jgi:curli biogenesis system outer membrane secretion channel CsgG
MNAKNLAAVIAVVVLSLSACSTTPEMGTQSAKTTVTGSAAGATSSGSNPQLDRCDKTLGTISVLEDQRADWFGHLRRDYKLGSTVPLLRLLIQQSNCFIVVERGRGLAAMEKERELMKSGELKEGQMVAADYGLTPEVILTQSDAGGIGGAIGAVAPRLRVLGIVGGNLKFKEAQTVLELIDNRSGVQLGIAEGSASKSDFRLFGGLIGGGAAGGLGGYSNTAEGKVIAAAFTDAYNQLVRSLRNYIPQQVDSPGGAGTGGTLQGPR